MTRESLTSKSQLSSAPVCLPRGDGHKTLNVGGAALELKLNYCTRICAQHTRRTLVKKKRVIFKWKTAKAHERKLKIRETQTREMRQNHRKPRDKQPPKESKMSISCPSVNYVREGTLPPNRVRPFTKFACTWYKRRTPMPDKYFRWR